MTIEFECPDCSREYRVKDSLAGKKVTCKDCGSRVSIPDEYADDEEWDDYESEPAPPPVRRKSKKSGKGSKKKAAARSSGALWKKIMGPLAILIGVVVAGYSVMALLDGNGRAVRGIFGGCVFAGVGIKWLRDE